MDRAFDRLSRLHRVTAALSEALTPREVAAVIVGHGVAALDAQAGRISVLRPDGRSVEVVGFSGYTHVRSPFELDERLPTSEVLRTGKPIFITNDAEVLARFPRAHDVVEPAIEGALASAPLIVEGRVVGAMTLAFAGDRDFSPDDRELLVALARQCAQALDRARLYELSLTVQEDLRRSRDQLAAILDGIAEGVTVQDTRGGLVYANAIAARLSGFESVDEFQREFPRTVQRFELLDESGEPLDIELLPGRRLLRGLAAKEIVVQFRNLDSGEWRWSMVDARPVHDSLGRLQLVVNIFRDITDRKRHTDATEFLAAASTILGSTLEIDTSLQQLAQLMVPRIADRCVIEVLEPDGTARRIAVPAALPRGAERKVGEPIVEATSQMSVKLVSRGQLLGTIRLTSLESGRRYAQVDAALLEDLARRAALAIDNARLFRDAQEKADHLQEALRTRDEFFAWASHDLRTPLASIKASAQLLQRQLARPEKSDRTRINESLERLDTTATRAAALVEELLDLARLQSGSPLELERQPVDLVRLASEVIAEHQPSTDRHTLELHSDAAELVGTWDARRLQRVLSNLLDNAVKYSPAGGPIKVGVRREDQSAVVTVADHGLGIPQHDQKRIFERFQRASNVGLRIRGTGIGLASSRHIVESHGGSITVESREGEGATFVVRLPLSPCEPDDHPPARSG